MPLSPPPLPLAVSRPCRSPSPLFPRFLPKFQPSINGTAVTQEGVHTIVMLMSRSNRSASLCRRGTHVERGKPSLSWEFSTSLRSFPPSLLRLSIRYHENSSSPFVSRKERERERVVVEKLRERRGRGGYLRYLRKRLRRICIKSREKHSLSLSLSPLRLPV